MNRTALRLALTVTVLLGAMRADAQETGPSGVGPSGQPLPRFASLKADRVNLRAGPGTEYPVSWVFRRAGLPVEIVKEFEAWRQIRDAEGVTGWVLHTFLSSRRTALVTPWDAKGEGSPPQHELKNSDSDSARAVAILEAGVIASLVGCDGSWCEVAVERVRGYLPQKSLWGVYPNETLR